MRAVLTALVLVAAALAPASALAQGPAGGGGGRGGMGGPSAFPSMPRAPGSPAIVSPMIQVQLDQLEDDLRLATAQYPAWNRLAEKIAALMDDVRRAREPGSALSGGAAEQFDALQAVARTRVAAIDEIAELGRAFYATLTPEQKAIADRRLVRLVTPSLGLPGLAAVAPPIGGPGNPPLPAGPRPAPGSR